jgi:hypothetical protein
MQSLFQHGEHCELGETRYKDSKLGGKCDAIKHFPPCFFAVFAVFAVVNYFYLHAIALLVVVCRVE